MTEKLATLITRMMNKMKGYIISVKKDMHVQKPSMPSLQEFSKEQVKI